MDNKHFTEIVIGNNKEEQAKAFIELAGIVVDHLWKYPWMNRFDREDIIQELVLFSFEKQPRFNASKGKAFNFFSTCMSAWCHCYCRSPHAKGPRKWTKN